MPDTTMASSSRSDSESVRASGVTARSRARPWRPSPRSQSTMSGSRCEEPLSRRTVRNSVRARAKSPLRYATIPSASRAAGTRPARRTAVSACAIAASMSSASRWADTMTRCWATPSAFSFDNVRSCWWMERSSSLPVTPSGIEGSGSLGPLGVRRLAPRSRSRSSRPSRASRAPPWRSPSRPRPAGRGPVPRRGASPRGAPPARAGRSPKERRSPSPEDARPGPRAGRPDPPPREPSRPPPRPWSLSGTCSSPSSWRDPRAERQHTVAPRAVNAPRAHHAPGNAKGEGVWALPFWECLSGCVLLSHTVTSAVPSALKGLASGFGMGPGVSPSL